MTTSDELIAVLALNPSHFDLYLVTADLLEEDGQWSLSQAFRYCGDNGKHPRKVKNPNVPVTQQKWLWLMFTEESESEFRQTYKHCTLPNEWRQKMERIGGSLKVSDSFLEAMQNLARVFTS